jgi:hypothetical protein
MPLALPEHTIHYPSAFLNTPNQRAILFSAAMSEFYPLEGVMPYPMAMATAMICMLNNVLIPIDEMGHGLTETALKQAEISPVNRTFTRPEEIRELVNTAAVRRLPSIFDGHNLQLFLHHTDQPLIMVVIL